MAEKQYLTTITHIALVITNGSEMSFHLQKAMHRVYAYYTIVLYRTLYTV